MADFDELVLPGYQHSSPRAYPGSDDDVVLADDFDIPISRQHYETPVQANFHDLLGLEDPLPTGIKPSKPTSNLDDIPVKGAAKSFDQLVEEQMRTLDGVATKRKPVQKREFLKRKSGLKGKVGGGKEMMEDYNPGVESRDSDQEQTVQEVKPKQSFLKRGEGKISVKAETVSTTPKPSSIPPKPSTQPRLTQAKSGTVPPTKPVPQSTSYKLNSSSDSKEAKSSYSGTGKSTFGKEDEIEICREELTVVEAVSIKPRLKETKEKPISETPIFRPNPKISENLEKLNFQIDQIRAQNLSDKDEMTLKEKQLSDLTSKLDDFLHSKSTKIQSLSRWKEEEMKKVKQERRLLDSKLAGVVPKRETEDFEELKSAISRLQDDLSLRETKRKATVDALKQALATMNTENRVLETELKELEKRRVKEGWTGRKQIGNKGKNGQVWG